ncbi:MAG: DUF962 domain-containing protein [Leptolyngbya sp. SIO3F4]|nr:DUF962 domain-containing protein [Leptolyngbya sp. SIO3F4]
MRSVEEWFSEYGESHQNQTNKSIHWICVPLIFFSIIGLLSVIPAGGLKSSFPEGWQPYMHAGTLLILFGLLFYLRLSVVLALGMVLVSAVILYVLKMMHLAGLPVGWISLGIFVGAWIGQFIGHKIEGKKPSFLKDLQFLMIGPIWLMGFLFRSWGIRY